MNLPAGKERLLKLFFQDPWTELHQREMARRAKVPVQNAHKYLGEFVEDGLLLRREVSNMTFFKPHWDSLYLLKFFEIFEVSRREEFFNRNKSIARLLTKATEILVQESQRNVQLVMLFGSVARETWSSNSDVDLLVLGATSGSSGPIADSFTKAKAAVQSVLELAPAYNSIGAAIIGFRERRSFYRETWGDRIVLYNESLFWQIVRKGIQPHG